MMEYNKINVQQEKNNGCNNCACPVSETDITNSCHFQNVFCKNKTLETLSVAENEARVLVLYTGGTIGMMPGKNGGLVPIPRALERNLRHYSHLHDARYSAARSMVDAAADAPLVLPDTHEDRRVVYVIYEYDPLLDSSNMTMDDWIHIAKDIRRFYELFDGFVILHGTDTLSYTAAALSFMLENLGKTIVITGSQIPVFETRSDGRDNFVGALIIAGNYCIPEVTVYFNQKLLRGNRTTKISASSLNAFDSPNMQPLATVGINIQVNYRAIFRSPHIRKFQVHTSLNSNVGLLSLFPSITTQTVKAFLQPPMQGVVIQTYGSGNMPSNRMDLIQALKEAVARGVLIINCTQCIEGSVDPLYDAGQVLLNIGVIPASDMTPEAALTKLSYVLAKEEWDLNSKKQKMETNLRGEMTVHRKMDIIDSDLIEAVARILHLSSSTEMDQLRDALFPSILCCTVMQGDMKKLETLKNYGADLSAFDYDRRTPLHIAASEGNVTMVEYLLKHGASVHIKDRNNQTPLRNALQFNHQEVIKLLVQCGAYLEISPLTLGEQLCSAAAVGATEVLKSYQLAGANLSQPDTSNRTALHLAVQNNKLMCVRFLLDHGLGIDCKDIYGYTPVDIARMLGRHEAIDILHARRGTNDTRKK